MTTEWPKTCRTIIRTRSGEPITGLWNDVTEEEFDNIKSVLTEWVVRSDGWQINVETETGWVIVPGTSVDFINVEFPPENLPLPRKDD